MTSCDARTHADGVIYWFMVASVAKCALDVDLHAKLVGIHPALLLITPMVLQVVFTIVLWLTIPKIQHSVTVAGVNWEKGQTTAEQPLSTDEEKLINESQES